ncbi:MAG: hypothetical protein ABL998_20330, partial [Planctomycetota bacterium]
MPLVLLAAACREGGGSSSNTNLGLAVDRLVGAGELQALTVSESSQDGSDLDGDGDALDLVVHVLDFATGELANLGLAQDGPLAVGGNLLAFGVSEEEQDETDLNGDGDTFDVVLHVYDSATGVATSTGLALEPTAPLAIGEATVAFLVSEPSQAGDDLNSDGDALDRVLHAYD